MDLPEILYKFRTIGKYTDDILCNKRLFFPNWEKLNDPHEVRICVKSPNEDMLFNMHPVQLKNWGVPVEASQVFVCSLSKRWSSNLLWSHYAAGHTGIAIGIDTSSLPSNIEVMDVVYGNDIPIFEPPVTKSTLTKALKHKSEEWKYEKEVRMVSFEDSFEYLKNITIKEVVFGMKTSHEDKYRVINLLRGDTVEFFDVRPAAREYTLSRHAGACERLYKFHPRNESK